MSVRDVANTPLLATLASFASPLLFIHAALHPNPRSRRTYGDIVCLGLCGSKSSGSFGNYLNPFWSCRYGVSLNLRISYSGSVDVVRRYLTVVHGNLSGYCGERS